MILDDSARHAQIGCVLGHQCANGVEFLAPPTLIDLMKMSTLSLNHR